MSNRELISAAIGTELLALLANGGGKLTTSCLGIKNYDRFRDQRCDCSYGMGPRHGSVMFSVGLKPEFRLHQHPGPLSVEAIDAALYVLNNLESIQAAKEAGQ